MLTAHVAAERIAFVVGLDSLVRGSGCSCGTSQLVDCGIHGWLFASVYGCSHSCLALVFLLRRVFVPLVLRSYSIGNP